MTAHTFDAVAFRSMFPAFASDTKYPDGALSGYFTLATNNISAYDNTALAGDTLQLALNLMTAHIGALFSGIADGTGSLGVQTSASIDKVSVSYQPPPYTSSWQFWLGKTPYGQQLLFLLQSMAAGGFYIGGLPEDEAFRKVGGVF